VLVVGDSALYYPLLFGTTTTRDTVVACSAKTFYDERTQARQARKNGTHVHDNYDRDRCNHHSGKTAAAYDTQDEEREGKKTRNISVRKKINTKNVTTGTDII
jgi:hypothetical protein